MVWLMCYGSVVSAQIMNESEKWIEVVVAVIVGSVFIYLLAENLLGR